MHDLWCSSTVWLLLTQTRENVKAPFMLGWAWTIMYIYIYIYIRVYIFYSLVPRLPPSFNVACRKTLKNWGILGTRRVDTCIYSRGQLEILWGQNHSQQWSPLAYRPPAPPGGHRCSPLTQLPLHSWGAPWSGRAGCAVRGERWTRERCAWQLSLSPSNPRRTGPQHCCQISRNKEVKYCCYHD